MEMNKNMRIYGKVTDQMQNPMAYVCVRLLQKVRYRKRSRYKIIQEGQTDQEGNYTFVVSAKQERVYKVIVLGYDEL